MIPDDAIISESTNTGSADHHSDAAVRYIAGWCVSKLMKSKQEVIRKISTAIKSWRLLSSPALT